MASSSASPLASSPLTPLPFYPSPCLIVGAGGIGCELLKSLVLEGYRDLTVVDLDTIDVSNLNRQFLFRRAHVGKSKAIIAKEAIERFDPLLKAPHSPLFSHWPPLSLSSHHHNIKDQELFGLPFFRRFRLVFNALDNVEARRHVNRLVLSAAAAGSSITLVESGTQGFLGQTTLIRPGVTECFECAPAAQTGPRTYAVCTIRNTPDAPIHCIVWGKFIYNALFGPRDDDNIMNDVKVEAGNEKEAGEIARNLFTRLFTTEIEKQCEVKERWAKRAPPIPLYLDSLLSSLPPLPSKVPSSPLFPDDQALLSPAQHAAEFLHSIESILTDRSSLLGSLSFDKDDPLSLLFVSAAANLRMYCYHIRGESRFSVKGMAGNIVHAIATTNAIAAGLMVKEAREELEEEKRMDREEGKEEKKEEKESEEDQVEGKKKRHYQSGKTTWITRGPHLLRTQALEPPRPSCYVCGKQLLTLSLDVHTFTLRRLFDRVLQKRLGFNEPSIDVFSSDNFIGTKEDHEEEGEGADEEEEEGQGEGERLDEEEKKERAPRVPYLDRPLSSRGILIHHGSQLSVDDQTQNLQVNMVIEHKQDWNEEENPDMFTITGSIPVASEEESKDEVKEDRKPSSSLPPRIDDDVIDVEEDGKGERDVEEMIEVVSEEQRHEREKDTTVGAKRKQLSAVSPPRGTKRGKSK